MPHVALISVLCPDRPGLVSAITGCLFDLGANLGDASFAVLGEGAEFASVCELPDGLSLDAVDEALKGQPELADAEISVRPFLMSPSHGPMSEVTHRIEITGGDQPGLVARICETLQQYNANIVSLTAGRSAGFHGNYVIRIAVWIPPENADSCLATVSNTAQHLQLSCRWSAD